MNHLGTTLTGTPRLRAEAKSKTGITRAGIDVRELARVKVVERNGRLYCYFNLGKGRKPERLPDPMNPQFEKVYALLYLASRRDIQDPSEGVARVLFPQKDPAYREYLSLLRDLRERGVVLPPLPGEEPRARKRPAVRPSRVYFIGGETGLIKIGCSDDVEKRLHSLQGGSPIPLSILATESGGITVERFYHRKFREHRSHREWFERHPDILAEIERLNQRLRLARSLENCT